MTLTCTNCNESLHLGRGPANVGEWIGDVATYYHSNPKDCVAATARRCAEIADSAVGMRMHVEGAMAVAAAIREAYPKAFAQEEVTPLPK